MDLPTDPLTLALVALAVCGLTLTWRVLWKGVALVAAALLWSRVEREYESK